MNSDLPQPPADEAAPPGFAAFAMYLRARRWWRLALFSPLSYLLVVLIARLFGNYFTAEPFSFAYFLNSALAPWWMGGIIAALCIEVVLRFKRRELPLRLQLWWRSFLAGLLICDAMAFAGLAAWYLTGRSEPFLVAALMAYVCLAIMHPKAHEFANC